MLQAKNIFLRAPEPADIDFLYEAENDESLWLVGELNQPLSRFTIKKYLENAHLTIAEALQLRLMICLHDGTTIGSIDLFEYDSTNLRAGVGIALLQSYRGRGLGAEALERLKLYANEILNLHQLYCHVQEDNVASIGLFSKCGFTTCGLQKDWLRQRKRFVNVYMMQCILQD
jgi:diamine N-acetyltransferase